MTYVLAVAKERNLTLSSVEDLKTSVVEVINLILKDYDLNKDTLTTGDKNQLCKELSEVVGEPEDSYEVESLAELILLRYVNYKIYPPCQFFNLCLLCNIPLSGIISCVVSGKKD